MSCLGCSAIVDRQQQCRIPFCKEEDEVQNHPIKSAKNDQKEDLLNLFT
jgi:hypothetical protein